MPDMFIVSWDVRSLQRLERLNPVVFYPAWDLFLKMAMDESLVNLRDNATTYMYQEFIDPKGPLEDNFRIWVYGWEEGELENDSPYAYRRNYGFSGMTDSLGRYYALDPGIGYMEYTVADTWYEVEDNYLLALKNLLAFLTA